MSLLARLKKLEPKKSSPVFVSWQFVNIKGEILEGEGYFSDLDNILFNEGKKDDLQHRKQIEKA